MIRISEWLPNPVGVDRGQEWMEFYNSGASPENISGWTVQNSKGKTVVLSGSVPSRGYLTVKTGEKFTLKNTGESLRLRDPSGKTMDVVSFMGSAPEGKSVSRHGTLSYFSSPTPGYASTGNNEAFIAATIYPIGVPISQGPGYLSIASFSGIVGVLFAVAISYLITKNNALHHSLFR